MVCGKPKLAAGGKNIGTAGDYLRVDDAPFVVPFLRPWVGKKHSQPRHLSGAKAGQEETRVVREYSDIAQIAVYDPAEERGDTVHKGFTADKTDIRSPRCLPCQMLASAKTDFEPNFIDTGAEITVRVNDIPALLYINFDFRQQFAHERLAFGAQFVALAAAENQAAADYLVLYLVAYHALSPFTQYFTLK